MGTLHSWWRLKSFTNYLITQSGVVFGLTRFYLRLHRTEEGNGDWRNCPVNSRILLVSTHLILTFLRVSNQWNDSHIFTGESSVKMTVFRNFVFISDPKVGNQFVFRVGYTYTHTHRVCRYTHIYLYTISIYLLTTIFLSIYLSMYLLSKEVLREFLQ